MNLDELEQLSKAATPGPWDIGALSTAQYWKAYSGPLKLVRYWDTKGMEHPPDDLLYIAACSPERIIALVRVARAAEMTALQLPAHLAFDVHKELIDSLHALEETP